MLDLWERNVLAFLSDIEFLLFNSPVSLSTKLGERSELHVGQFSIRILRPQSHAEVTDAECGLALSYRNM